MPSSTPGLRKANVTVPMAPGTVPPVRRRSRLHVRDGNGVAAIATIETPRVAGIAGGVETHFTHAVLYPATGAAAAPSPRELAQTIVESLIAGKLSPAIKLYATSEADIAEDVLAEARRYRKIRVELLQRCGHLFAGVEDWRRATKAFEEAGDITEAARHAERGDDLAYAAELWLQVSRRDKAVALYRRAGRHDRVAALAEAAGDVAVLAQALEAQGALYRAGKLWFDRRQQARAMGLLQKIPRGHHDFLAATALIVEILLTTGSRTVALQKLDTALAGEAVTPASAPLFTLKGRLLAEQAGVPHVANRGQHIALLEQARAIAIQVIEADATQVDAAKLLAEVTVRLSGHEHRLTPPVETPMPVAPAPAPAVVKILKAPETKVLDPDTEPSKVRALDVFSELSDDEFADVYPHFERVAFPAGSLLVEQESPSQAVFIVVSGRLHAVRLSSEAGGGRSRLLAVLAAGDVAGQLPLVAGEPASCRIFALEPVVTLRMTLATLDALETHAPRLAVKLHRGLGRGLSARLRRAFLNATRV
jgi:tetratricopeptide (TPR) repeat protein